MSGISTERLPQDIKPDRKRRGRKPTAWRIINEVAGAPHPGFATRELALVAAQQALFQFATPLLAEFFGPVRERVVDVSAAVNGSVAVDVAIVNHFGGAGQILMEEDK